MRRNGFTLLEIIVAIAILGLIYGVVSADFHLLFTASRISAAGQGLEDHFAYSVSRSYTTGKYHTMIFNLSTGEYRLKPGREDEAEAQEILQGRLRQGIKFTDIQVGYETYTPPGTLTVEISPLGVTNDLLVNLVDEKGNALALMLGALVQNVRRFEEYKTYEEIQNVPPL